MRFFVGLHQPADAQHITRAFISINRLRQRKSSFDVNEWILDSGAFTTLLKHGAYPKSVSEYAAQIKRWSSCGKMLAAVTQDYMCEAHMLKRTGLSVAEHQRLTIKRYDALRQNCKSVYIMPVLQGYLPADYARHVKQYGDRFAKNAWVGVGSICKRNASPSAVIQVLRAILAQRPDLRLHGFGLKQTALQATEIRSLLDSADSMAWSFAARYYNAQNDWREAEAFARRIENMPVRRWSYDDLFGGLQRL